MITYTSIQQADKNGVAFILNGDTTATVLKVNLSKQPFNILFGGVLPSSVSVVTNQFGLSATGDIVADINGDASLTLTFSAAPPVSNVGPSISFTYNSLP